MKNTSRTILIFDGDCGFCTRSAKAANKIARNMKIIPYQEADLTALGLTEEECSSAVQLITPEGTHSGINAVASVLRRSRWPLPLAGWILEAPGFHSGGEAAYDWVARHRHQLPGGTPACALPETKLT